jgi:hypothetical protein
VLHSSFIFNIAGELSKQANKQAHMLLLSEFSDHEGIGSRIVAIEFCHTLETRPARQQTSPHRSRIEFTDLK